MTSVLAKKMQSILIRQLSIADTLWRLYMCTRMNRYANGRELDIRNQGLHRSCHSFDKCVIREHEGDQRAHTQESTFTRMGLTIADNGLTRW